MVGGTRGSAAEKTKGSSQIGGLLSLFARTDHTNVSSHSDPTVTDRLNTPLLQAVRLGVLGVSQLKIESRIYPITV